MKKTTVRRCPCQGGTLVRFVQPIILSVLQDGPSHGYGILQQISRTRLWSAETPDPAGVYRALRDMEERGLVTSFEDPSMADRRLYALTEEGRECRRRWLKTLRQYRLGISEVISMLSREEGDSSV